MFIIIVISGFVLISSLSSYKSYLDSKERILDKELQLQISKQETTRLKILMNEINKGKSDEYMVHK